jgi:ectoine hydroxylase-related dioxygenase (phytanoyl-CoA dioxygenase family)
MDASLEVDSNISLVSSLHQHGVVICRNMINKANLNIIANEVNSIRNIVSNRISSLQRPLKNYSDIAERELGRFDYRCGFTADVFNQLADPISRIIQKASPTIDFRHYWGVIPSLGGSGPTPMHRDVYPILNTTAGDNLDRLDLELPPYYFTVLIPLVDITMQNGPTEFIKGSHRVAVVDMESATIDAPLSKPGDVIIFDGRIMHRGSANNTTHERIIAYITYVANWYHDQTFEINDYLFPDLSVKGR